MDNKNSIKMQLEINQKGRSYLTRTYGIVEAKKMIAEFNGGQNVAGVKPHHCYKESDLYKIRAVNINTGEVLDKQYFASNYRCALIKLNKETGWAISKNNVKYDYHVVKNTAWRIYNKSENVKI